MDALALAAENRGDTVASHRYDLLQQSFLKLSPILQPPYFDPATQNADYNRYVADVYLTDVIRMNEQQYGSGSGQGWLGYQSQYLYRPPDNSSRGAVFVGSIGHHRTQYAPQHFYGRRHWHGSVCLGLSAPITNRFLTCANTPMRLMPSCRGRS